MNNFLYPKGVGVSIEIPKGSSVGGFEAKYATLYVLIDEHDRQAKWVWEIWTTAFRLGGRSVYESKEKAVEALMSALDSEVISDK